MSRKRILEEQARELQEKQVRLENKYSEIQEELEDISYLIYLEILYIYMYVSPFFNRGFVIIKCCD